MNLRAVHGCTMAARARDRRDDEQLARGRRGLGAVCVVFGLLFNMSILVGQTAGKVSGKVIDADNGEPLIGANVLVRGTTMGGATDADGTFYILNVPPGKYDIQTSMVGYRRMTLEGVIVNAERTTTISFSLKSEAIETKEVVVEARRPDVEPEKTSTSEVIRTDEIENLAGVRDVGDALELAADVTDGHFRGGRTGEELYTLQGMGITNPLNNSTAFLPIMSAVEEVEVITSGFGAQYGNAQSGVVNIAMKEGRADRWRTRIESRFRAPGRKHFGPSVYDPAANPYLAFLLNRNVWWGSEDQTRYYTQMVDQFNNFFGTDTAARVQVAYALWKYQTKRDLNLNYGNQIDNSVEATAGGPVDSKTRLFLAFRNNTQWPEFPTDQPDLDRQFMGNVVRDLGEGTALRLSGGISVQDRNVFPSSNSLGFYNWIWDRLLSIQYRKTINSQVGLRFTQALSASTFYELKLNTLVTKTDQGSPVAPDWMQDDLLGSTLTNFSRMIAAVRTGPDRFNYGNGSDDFRDERTQTISFEGSFTSQVAKSHLLNAGVQANAYLIDVNNRNNTRNNQEGMQLTQYTARPLEGALYVQDKMEFQGMIANVGLRLDLWAENTDVYDDVFSPYRYYTSDSTFVYDKNLAPKSRSPILGRLQPRVGVSFPVSVSTVFHLNYSTSMQRPSFQYVVAQSESQASGRPNQFGNPRLLPQSTNSYDVGVMQGFGDGFTLDVSGYYKDVKNLIESVVYTDRGGRTYNTFANRDYADIRGFRVSLNKRRGNFQFSMNYHFSVATGKSSTPFLASPAYQEEPNTGQVIADLQNVPVKDILLDFDRTHNLIIHAAYVTRDAEGPRLFGFYPLQDMSVAVSSFVRSGRPYTYSIGVKEINNKRTPNESSTDVKISKRIRDFFGTGATVYMEVFNLFDQKILNYSYIFDQSNTNASFNITRYESAPIDAPNGIRYLNSSNAAPFLVDQSFLIYDNSPRSFTFGLVIEL